SKWLKRLQPTRMSRSTRKVQRSASISAALAIGQNDPYPFIHFHSRPTALVLLSQILDSGLDRIKSASHTEPRTNSVSSVCIHVAQRSLNGEELTEKHFHITRFVGGTDD